MPNVSVIIIHWNTPDALKKQLETLSKSPDTEIIIVDNFSSPETSKTVSALSRKVSRIILNDENLGFASAGNLGAQLAKGEWLLFLNPDAAISEESVQEFVKKAASEKFDAASPQTADPRYSKPVPSVSSLLVEFSPLHRVVPLSTFKTKTLTGGCLLIKKNVFERVGRWDEKFFLWFEDSDLTKRLLDGGYRIGFVDVPVDHTGGISFEKMDNKTRRSIFFTSMKTYAKKHFSPPGRLITELLSRRFT